ncbi:protein Flattop-like [Echinops telfairi]|uniref:Protein Flattop-like n=1 Tax=Echinops telfairi TaxID=9371 RepID=A0AC55CSR5_ECHTE|nr:protein Flattop-like [Echinops telfairi]
MKDVVLSLPPPGGPPRGVEYEKAFSSKYLQNWSPSKSSKESISSHEGYTQIITNDRSHLLPLVPHSKASPWGSFMGTWQMLLKIPPAWVTLTSHTMASAASLTKWIQKNPDLLKASNGLCPETLGKLHDADSRKKLGEKAMTKTEQQAPKRTSTPNSPATSCSFHEQLQSPPPAAGPTPALQNPPASPNSSPGSPCSLECWQGPTLTQSPKCKPGASEENQGHAEKENLTKD